MPGFVTHYIFGVNAYKQIDNSDIHNIIYRNRQAYSLGLQGPDLFYYFMPASLGFKPNIANIIHKKKTNEFFRQLMASVSSLTRHQDYETAFAYIEGFMGHYLLDTAMHPYVYSRVGTSISNRTLGEHFAIETDIDREVLWKYKKKHQTDFPHSSCIRLSPRERSVIARILSIAILATYDINVTTRLIKAAMVSFKIESSMLIDEKTYKHNIIQFIEKRTLGYNIISPLLINEVRHVDDPCNLSHERWANPWDKENCSTESVFEIMESAASKYASYMIKMADALDDAFEVIEDNSPAILEMLCNNSYNSGLDCRKKLKREK